MSQTQTFDVDAYMRDLTDKLQRHFGERLVYVGLQGSCRRGEADDKSDIDAVVIVDQVDIETLAAYRDIVNALPESDRACGFFGGINELRCWPAHELFQFRLDTVDVFGKLNDLLPPIQKEDAVEALRIGAATIYHMVCHTSIHGGDAVKETFVPAFRMLFFPLLAKQWLATGEYALSRSALTAKLPDNEAELMRIGTVCRADPAVITEQAIRMILEWCGKNLQSYCTQGGHHGKKAGRCACAVGQVLLPSWRDGAGRCAVGSAG